MKKDEEKQEENQLLEVIISETTSNNCVHNNTSLLSPQLLNTQIKEQRHIEPSRSLPPLTRGSRYHANNIRPFRFVSSSLARTSSPQQHYRISDNNNKQQYPSDHSVENFDNLPKTFSSPRVLGFFPDQDIEEEEETKEEEQQSTHTRQFSSEQLIEQKHQEEAEEMRELLAEKKELIHVELRKILALMDAYHAQASKLSRWDNITKGIVTFSSALAAVGLYIGVDKKSTDLNDVFYYISLTSTSIAAVLGQLTNSWNLSERAHNNTTTYRGLHNLHDFVSFQLVRGPLTSLSVNSLIGEIQSRLLLIRDSAERGTYQPRSSPQFLPNNNNHALL